MVGHQVMPIFVVYVRRGMAMRLALRVELVAGTGHCDREMERHD